MPGKEKLNRRQFLWGAGVVAAMLAGCGRDQGQGQLPLPVEPTLEPTLGPEPTPTVEAALAQHPLYLINNNMLQELVGRQDPKALEFAAKMEELIHKNPDWQNKNMADFEMSVMMLSGEGKQANEGQLYATIEGQTWILGWYQEGGRAEAIVQPLVTRETELGAMIGFGQVTLMESAINEFNGKEGVRVYRMDRSYVFSDQSKLSVEGVSQKANAALMAPVKLNAELGIVATKYAEKTLSGMDKSGNIVATYDFKNKEWIQTMPTYADWMLPHVEGLVGEQKDGVFYLVKETTDGRRIKVFEFVKKTWQPAYDFKPLVREDKTFDLETAMQTMFMRMGPVDNVDGQAAMSVNMEDYQRFAQECQSIWNGLTGLVSSGLGYRSGGNMSFALGAGKDVSMRIENSVNQWQLIGWAKNPAGAESVFVIATSDGPVALLNVGGVGYTHLNNKDSIEEGVMELANQTSTKFGLGDVIMLLLDPRSNPQFNGTVDPVKAELMRAYVRGMGIKGEEITAMMFGDITAQRKALKFMLEHYPVPIYDFSGDM